MFLTSLIVKIKQAWEYLTSPSKYYAKKYAKKYAKEYSKKLSYNITNDYGDSDSISNSCDYNDYY